MIKSIQGGIAKDHRGDIKFVNDFDMSLVKRFYIISNGDTEFVRGWRAHKIEQRWFYVLKGSFAVDLVKIENWVKTPKNLDVQREVIRATDRSVMHVSRGYATAFKALEPDSQLMVFADHAIENASKDDYTFPVDYFTKSTLHTL